MPDYPALVKFFLEPLLDMPESLSIDCEHIDSSHRVWIRVALDASDRGRAVGRDGRNLQAMRSVLNMAAAPTGQRVTLEIYGERSSHSHGDNHRSERSPRRSSPRTTPVPRPRRKD